MRVIDLTKEDWVKLERHLKVYYPVLPPRFYLLKSRPGIHMRGEFFGVMRKIFLKPFKDIPRCLRSKNTVIKSVCAFRLEVGK